MGVDAVLFERLCELSTRFRPEGRSLMLGRQGFRIQPIYAKTYERALRSHGLEGRRFDYLQDDGFSETLFARLGLGEIETMDFSDYEGATILQDLNRPVPQDLHGQFDFIFDGGTIEHVFDVPQALRNVFTMLKPGGRFVSANGMNNWTFHGIYQFNPELVWTFWTRGAKCRVEQCLGLPQVPDPNYKTLSFPDPAATGRRLRFRGQVPAARTYLYYEIEKMPDSVLGDTVLQSDYEAKWADHTNAGMTRLDMEVEE